MSKHKWQHFLPEMYLRAFVDPARVAIGQHDLWIYRAGEEPKSRAPKGVASEAHFYTTDEIDDPIAVEKTLAQIEGRAVAHMDKLRAADVNLTPQEKAEVATFVGLQLMRTPLARERANAVAIELMRQAWKKTLDEGKLAELVAQVEAATGEGIGTDLDSLEKFGRRIADGTVEMTQQSKAWNMKHVLSLAVEFGETLERMHWALLEAPEGSAFITSDNPVLVADPTAKQRGPKGFSPSTLMRVTFPLSPQLMLYADFYRRADERAEISPESVRQTHSFQIEQAFKEVYASFRCDELKAEVDRALLTRPPLEWTLPPEILE